MIITFVLLYVAIFLNESLKIAFNVMFYYTAIYNGGFPLLSKFGAVNKVLLKLIFPAVINVDLKDIIA